jgi:5-methylcytosine-specific restriction endonuclease McrA
MEMPEGMSPKARVTSHHSAGELRDAADRLSVIADRMTSGEATRAELDQLLTDLRTIAIREFGPRRAARRGEGGKGKILDHLKRNVGEWVHGEELAAVSGIQEWARRTREWRTQEGYDIEEDGGFYRLNSADPDEKLARRWRVANEIRRRRGGATSRLLAYLIANEGRVVTRDELDYVARIKEGSRRVRELRDEQGWPIESHIDDPNMQPGQYRLASAAEEDRRDIRQRLYAENLRERVFERDNYTCQRCGRNRERAEKAEDPRFYLELHHKKAVAEELDALSPEELNEEDNLITYCHRDHLEETARLQKRRRDERRGN